MKLAAMLALALSSWAAQSLVLPTSIATAAAPNTAPYSSATAQRILGRITSASNSNAAYRELYKLTVGGTDKVLIGMNGNANQEFCAYYGYDTQSAYGSTMCVNVAGVSDFVFVWVRDVAGLATRLRVWNNQTGQALQTYCGQIVLGTNINTFDCPISSVGSGNSVGTISVGNASITAGLAWLKWQSSAVVPTEPPQQYDAADLGDWRFEGNANDANGVINLTPTSPTYSASPILPPAAVIRTMSAPANLQWVSLRAGHSNQMRGDASYSRGDSATLTYQWAVTSGPSRLLWNSQTAANPTLTGVIATTDGDPYTFALRVVDSLGAVANTSLEVGAVAMDSNGVLIDRDPNTFEFFGPQIAFGRNPWPAADERHQVLSEFFGGLLSTDYADTWHGVTGQTATFTNGSATVAISAGPNFNSRSGCVAGSWLTANVPVTNGVTIQRQTLASCGTTTATLNAAWGGTSGTYVWGIVTSAQEFVLSSGNQNMNYYDHALSYLDLWKRSGMRRYRDFGVTMARRWWAQPFINRKTNQVAPRVLSPWGLWACAVLVSDCESGDPNMVDFRSDYDASYFNDQLSFVTGAAWLSGGNTDIREEAYRQMGAAYPAQFCPGCAHYSDFRAAITSGLTNRWYPAQQGSGVVLKPIDSGTNTVNVTNGSATVTAISPFTFPASFCDTPPTWVEFIAFQNGTVDEPAVYQCTWVSSTQITLNTPYAGTTGGRIIGSNPNIPLVGQGAQPFTQGIAGIMAWRQNRALNSTAGTSLLLGINDWIRSTGFNPANNGLYYGRIFPGCEPPTTYINCTLGATDAGGDMAGRFYAVETLAQFALRELVSPSADNRTRGDLHYGRNFGRDGGPSTNGEYYSAFYGTSAFTVMGSKLPKDVGFAFGVGRASAWPAARLGGVAPPDTRTVTMSLAVPAGATSTSVTYTAPSGASSVVSCSLAAGRATCSLPTDWRQGNYLHRITHTVASGSLVSDSLPLRVQ